MILTLRLARNVSFSQSNVSENCATTVLKPSPQTVLPRSASDPLLHTISDGSRVTTSYHH